MICPACTNNEEFEFIKKIDAFELFSCKRCDVHFFYPQNTVSANWYETDSRYSARNKDPYRQISWKQKQFLKNKWIKSGRLLDVGCGTGNFLAYAKKAGFDTWGIDFDADAVFVAQETFGQDNTSVATLSEFHAKNQNIKFDAVTFFEVLEHLTNPADFIDEIKLVLKSKGYVALSVPFRNANPQFMLYDKPLRHWTRWDEKSLSHFFQTNDFEVLEIKKMAVPFEYIIGKVKLKAGPIFKWGLVGRAKKAVRANRQEIKFQSKQEKMLTFLHFLAKTKDFVFFSIPALIWLIVLIIKGKQYLNLYLLARLQK